jgi:hypothetical protein
LGALLRKYFYQSFNLNNSFVLASCIGFAGSPLLAKLGWTLVNWDDFLFVGSFDGWFSPDQHYAVGWGWMDFPGLTPYCGEQLTTIESASHDWEKHYHLWISNPAVALNLEKTLRAVLNNDLILWQTTIDALNPLAKT